MYVIVQIIANDMNLVVVVVLNLVLEVYDLHIEICFLPLDLRKSTKNVILRAK